MLFKLVLQPYQKQIENKIKQFILGAGNKNALQDACEYALLNGGKRFRPALVLMIAKALGHGANVDDAALSIELFHTASLIADDLPCMDDDDLRRNKPSLHCVFGESTSILTTYALIAAGYECLVKNRNEIRNSSLPFRDLADSICVQALQNVSENTGLWGATGGQFLDLSLTANLTENHIKDIFRKKTVSLFEITFVLGWLFGGGDFSLLETVKKSAGHFGMAFQIADDIQDCKPDAERKDALNIVNLLGMEQTTKMFHEEIEQFKQTLELLNLNKSDLCVLSSLLCQKK